MLAAGGALAVVQPGDLGDEETAAPDQATTTTTTTAPDVTTSTTVEVTTTTAAPTTTTAATGGSTTTIAPGGGTTTTTIGGSGLGDGSTPSGGSRGIADTGGESMIGAGMGLAALGLLLRRAARPRTA